MKVERTFKVREDLRQLTHFGVAVATVLVVHFVGFNSSLLLISALFLFGLVLANIKILGGKVKLVDQFLALVDREVLIPGQGAMFFAAGILLLLTFQRPLELALGVIMLHGAGDAFATIVGIRFNSKLPWNSKKTWQGLVAFIVFGVLAASFFIPLTQAVTYAVILAFVESLALPLDDNVAVPASALILRGFGI
mgnify:CR=1 FL=1